MRQFNSELGSLLHRYKIVIAGNHELGFEDDQDEVNLMPYFKRESFGTPEGYKLLTNCTYLMNSSIEVDDFLCLLFEIYYKAYGYGKQ